MFILSHVSGMGKIKGLVPASYQRFCHPEVLVFNIKKHVDKGHFDGCFISGRFLYYYFSMLS